MNDDKLYLEDIIPEKRLNQFPPSSRVPQTDFY